MYIILLKVYYSSFSAVTACMFDWLIDGRSLVKTKLNHLINSVCFPQHRNYSVKVHSEKYSTWIWEIKYQFAEAKIDWLTWWCSFRFTRYCTLNSSYCKKRHIFCPMVLQTLISINKSTWLTFKICWRRLAQNFFMDNFDLVLLNKLIYSLSSSLLYTSMC